MGDLIALMPLITVFLLFYLILYIPQRRRQKKHKSYIEALKIGDDVITDSGIYGRVTKIKDERAYNRGPNAHCRNRISARMHGPMKKDFKFKIDIRC